MKINFNKIKYSSMSGKQILSYIWTCVQRKQIDRDEFDKLVKLYSDRRQENLKMSGKRYEE